MGMGSSFQTAAASVRGSSKEEEEGKRRRRGKGDWKCGLRIEALRREDHYL